MPQMRKLQLITACEGPLALNNYAFEVCRDLLPPHGDRFFAQVSRYGDYLAEVEKKTGDAAGSTSKLILPFLKAHGLTNDRLQEYCARHLSLMPDAVETYRFLHGRNFPIFALSGAYRPCAAAVGRKLGFTPSRIFGLDLDLDRYQLSPGEAEELLRLEEEIVALPALEWPAGAASRDDLAPPVQEAVAKLEQIFWARLPALEIGALYREVHSLGGPEKARALADILADSGLTLADTVYAGAGGTDVPALEAVRAGDGLSLSFNGDARAVKAAEVIVVADSAWPLALLVSIFQLWGKEGVLEVAAPETRAKSRALVLPDEVVAPIFTGLQGHGFNLYDAGNSGMDRIAQESAAMAAKLKGAAIAAGENH